MEFGPSTSSGDNLNALPVLVKFLASLRPSYYICKCIKRGLTRPANLPLAQGGYLERGMWPQRQRRASALHGKPLEGIFMFKRREFLKSAAAALGAIPAWLLVPVSSSAKIADVPPELDLETAIYRWSKKSEYSTKRLTGYGAFYGGSRDLGSIRDYVTDYYAKHLRFPRGWHVVTRYFRCTDPVGTRKFNVCFAPAWGEDCEPVDFFDTNVHIGIAIEDSILDGSFLPGQRAS
jgi:hypothetical protein